MFDKLQSFGPQILGTTRILVGHAGKGFWPILNGGELAIAYGWLSLYLAAQGPGAWALDNLRQSRLGRGLSEPG